MIEYLRLITQLADNPSVCALMQLFSYNTWQRIEFVRNSKGLKMFETTVTQNWLYEFRLFSMRYPAYMTMYEAIDENSNGNDIEFAIQIGGCVVLMPLQAKIIYHNNKYDAMEHGPQVNDLINYANLIGGIPMYLLYNYHANPRIGSSNLCENVLNKWQYGCTLISARYLRRNYAFNRIDRNGNVKWTIPEFHELHPAPAFPWWKIVCCLSKNGDVSRDLGMLFSSIGFDNVIDDEDPESNIRLYPIQEINRDNKWKAVIVGEELSIGASVVNDNRGDSYRGYNPKYRFLLRYNTDESGQLRRD